MHRALARGSDLKWHINQKFWTTSGSSKVCAPCMGERRRKEHRQKRQRDVGKTLFKRTLIAILHSLFHLILTTVLQITDHYANLHIWKLRFWVSWSFKGHTANLPIVENCVLNTLHKFSLGIFTIPLQSRYYYLHFKAEEIEVNRT